MTVKRITAITNLILLLFITACASTTRQNEPPQLLTAISNRINTAIVYRGTLEQLNQYPGIIRIDSDRLTFGNTTLRFAQFEVMVGDRVKEGDVLARLDTRDIEKQLKNLLNQISSTIQDHLFENDLINADILIFQSELTQLYAAGASSTAISLKKLDIEQKQLELSNSLARQELIINDLIARLNSINERLDRAEIRAPYDGLITWLADVSYRDFLHPFQTVICISDEKEMFIEYASVDNLRIHIMPTTVLKAKVGDSIYDLSVRALDDDEVSFFFLNRLTAPVRFDVLNPDDNLKPGAFVVIQHYVNISHDTLIIPTNSVYGMQMDRFVYINNNGTKEPRIIETGIRNRALIEVLSGLEEGDEVFVR